MTEAQNINEFDQEPAHSALPLSALKENPLVDITPGDTINNAANVVAALQELQADSTFHEEASDAARDGIYRMLRCVRAALEYEATAGLERRAR